MHTRSLDYSSHWDIMKIMKSFNCGRARERYKGNAYSSSSMCVTRDPSPVSLNPSTLNLETTNFRVHGSNLVPKFSDAAALMLIEL